MRRNAAIELYRCLLMFGIVLMHCVSQGPIVLLLPYRLLMACVTGFVFISGYYGIKCTTSKILHLLITTLVCSAIGVFACGILGLESDMSIWRYFISGNWFVWAYLVLMVIAPIIDRAVESSGGHCWAIPFLVVVFVWNFLSGMPDIGRLLPKPVGFGSHTFFMMMGVYLAARLFRIYGVEDRIRGLRLSVLLLLGGFLCAVGFSHYDSPISFVFVASLFCLFKRLRLPPFVSNLVLLVAPSMLSVYLLHWSPLGVHILRSMESKGGGYGVALLTAVTLFALAILLDIPRRTITQFILKMFARDNKR